MDNMKKDFQRVVKMYRDALPFSGSFARSGRNFPKAIMTASQVAKRTATVNFGSANETHLKQAEEIKAARDGGNEKSVNDREQWFRGFAFVLDQLGYTLVWEDNTHVSVKTLMWAMNH